MYSATIDIVKIGNLKVKFSLVLLDNEDPKKKTGNSSVVSKLMKGGNQYLKFQSKGRLVLEYVTDAANWAITNQIGFTRVHFYSFLRKMRVFVYNFQIPNLFTYGMGNRLLLNREISDQNKLVYQTTNRACMLEYSVVQDQQNQEIEYEGCILCINQRGNAIFLSYDEISTLMDILARVNFDSLSMHLIEGAKLYENLPAKQFGNDAYIISQNPPENTIYRGPSKIERPNLFP